MPYLTNTTIVYDCSIFTGYGDLRRPLEEELDPCSLLVAYCQKDSRNAIPAVLECGVEEVRGEEMREAAVCPCECAEGWGIDIVSDLQK